MHPVDPRRRTTDQRPHGRPTRICSAQHLEPRDTSLGSVPERRRHRTAAVHSDLRLRHETCIHVMPVPLGNEEALVTTGGFGRVVAVVYGVVAYVGFLAVTLYAIAFLADLGVSHTVDRGPHRSETAAAV